MDVNGTKRTFRIRRIGKIEQYFWLTLGIFVMAVAYYFFVLPSGLVTGGATGIAIIMTRFFPNVPLSAFSLIFNTVFMMLALAFLGKKEFLNTVMGSLMFPAFLAFFEFVFPDPSALYGEGDLLLVSLYAGMLIGAGFGIVCKYGGSTGGTDIAIKVVKRYTPLSLSASVYVVEASIIVAGALTFPTGLNEGILTALYAIVVVFISGKVSDSIVIGSQSKKAVNIITDHPREIKTEIYKILRRGMTEIQSQGGYTENRKTMLVIVILNDEYHIVRNIIVNTDPKAFVYVTPASEIHGEWSSREEAVVRHEDGQELLQKR
ncbi:MAG: YitT family protein [Candidatus Izemoplasmatales bacterium]